MRVRLWAPLILAALGACTHEPVEGVVLTRTELLTHQVPVAVVAPPPPEPAPRAPATSRCGARRIAPAPAYPDRDDALREAPSIYEQVQMLLAGRRMRMERERELTEALRNCLPPER